MCRRVAEPRGCRRLVQRARARWARDRSGTARLCPQGRVHRPSLIGLPQRVRPPGPRGVGGVPDDTLVRGTGLCCAYPFGVDRCVRVSAQLTLARYPSGLGQPSLEPDGVRFVDVVEHLPDLVAVRRALHPERDGPITGRGVASSSALNVRRSAAERTSSATSSTRRVAALTVDCATSSTDRAAAETTAREPRTATAPDPAENREPVHHDPARPRPWNRCKPGRHRDALSHRGGRVTPKRSRTARLRQPAVTPSDRGERAICRGWRWGRCPAARHPLVSTGLTRVNFDLDGDASLPPPFGVQFAGSTWTSDQWRGAP